MTTDQPTDTRVMGIVHSALRRDLARIRTVLSAPPYPQGQSRRAIAAHTLWMMRFLHHHHNGEDTGLYPPVRVRNPAAAPLLDAMNSDHQAIVPGIDNLIAAASRYAEDADARDELTTAVLSLEESLLPHLRREELEMMPVVSQTLSRAEWDRIQQDYFVAGKSKVELAEEGHWLIDNADPESRRAILEVVNPLLRYLLLYGFARRYRRKRDLMWGNGPASLIPPLTVHPAEVPD